MSTNVVQMVYDSVLTNQRQNWWQRIWYKLVTIPFERIKAHNPLVETGIGKVKIKIPFSHQLPFILKSAPFYASNLVRIADAVQRKYADMTFIDIGANIGDSVALLREKTKFPILCVEGDPYFFSVLQENSSRFPDVYLSPHYVGESNAKISAVSVELGGTAHLSESKSTTQAIPLKPLPAILDTQPRFKRAKMLKIDTDGFDNKIIRGSVSFLKSAKPVIFFEYDPFFLEQQHDDGLSVFNLLTLCGYDHALIYDNGGELLLTADLNNIRLLEDITHFYTGRKGLRYCDICAFHSEDNNLFERVRKSEIEFFERSRA